MAKFNYVMDVTKEDSFVQSCTARQGDAGETITFNLYDDGLPISRNIISKAELIMVTPMGHYIEQSMTIASDPLEPTGSILTTTLTSNFNAESGMAKRMYVKLTMTTSGLVKTSPDVIYYVIPAGDISGGSAHDYISRVEEIIQQVTDLYNQYKEDLKNVYDTTTRELKDKYDQAVAELNQSVTDFTTNLTNQLTTLTGKIDDLTDRINGLDGAVSDLQAKMDDLIANGAMTQAQADNRYMAARGSITSDTQLDSTKQVGTYEIAMTHPTLGNLFGTLLVQGNVINPLKPTQLMVLMNKVMYRRFNGTVWNTWTEVGQPTQEKGAIIQKNTIITNQALNTILDAGVYRIKAFSGSNGFDSLTGSDGYIEVYGFENESRLQRVTMGNQTSGSVKEVWFRYITSVTVGAWTKVGGTEIDYATAEDIVIGESDTLMVTPKALKEATETTVPFKEYFGMGEPTQNVASGEYSTVKLGKSQGTSTNGQTKRPYTINSDGTLTLTRAARLNFKATVKIVAGNTGTIALYMYWYLMNPQTQLPSGMVGDDVEIVSFGSTRATNGQLNYNWIASGNKTLDLPAGQVISFNVRTQTNAAFRWAQVESLEIEEVLPAGTQGLNISSLADNPVVRLSDLNAILKQQQVNTGMQMVNGENFQVTDPTLLTGLPLYASNSSSYSTLPDGETYFTQDSKGLITIKKAGYYELSAVVKTQYRVDINNWHYISMVRTRTDGSSTDWDFMPTGGAIRNRNRRYATVRIKLEVGEKISFKSDTNLPSGSTAIQFINVDWFALKRLGD
ncbi:hypothetical protein [Candidatus Enterococcus murrayae]|uniref:BppU N-terminal domain-containing protein n=1 Tax=Candidatus Enterococcus murrayae TaxID=2815321 RepID=A0ABS3HCP2_9ENTE|nr:hypothetical protein [Enterococcus sp. MJM16]MBO0450749.1 hypothetical protein [Enterococcus sp. MJM16]